ncbi:hypothetical protein EV363DRAFT_1360525 [Boletus edulis]|nr:hypothetical protein EV363DRAFT_1360525 [Boletus edulis]
MFGRSAAAFPSHANRNNACSRRYLEGSASPLFTSAPCPCPPSPTTKAFGREHLSRVPLRVHLSIEDSRSTLKLMPAIVRNDPLSGSDPPAFPVSTANPPWSAICRSFSHHQAPPYLSDAQQGHRDDCDVCPVTNTNNDVPTGTWMQSAHPRLGECVCRRFVRMKEVRDVRLSSFSYHVIVSLTVIVVACDYTSMALCRMG